MALSEMLMQIIKQLAEALAFTRCCYRADHLLRLPAVAVRRHHQPPGDDVRRFVTEIFAHQMQTKIDARGAAGGGHQPRIADVQHVFHHFNQRKTLLQPGSITPMGGGLPAVEQFGGGEHKYPGTDRDDSAAARIRCRQRLAQRLRNLAFYASPAGDDDGVRFVKQRQPAVADDTNTAGGAKLAIIDGGDREPIPAIAHFRARETKNLDRHAELEGTQAVIGQNDDFWW